MRFCSKEAPKAPHAWSIRQRWVPWRECRLHLIVTIKQAPLTTWSSSLRRVSAAKHHTAEQYSETGKIKTRKHLPKSNLSWKTRKDFLKMPNLWEAALETERRCFSKSILISKCHSQYNKVIRLLQHSSSNSLCGWLEMNCAWPGDYHCLSLTQFNFTHRRLHLSLTLPRSRFRASATVTLIPGDGTAAIKVESSHNQ